MHMEKLRARETAQTLSPTSGAKPAQSSTARRCWASFTLFIEKFHKPSPFQEFYLSQMYFILSIDTFFTVFQEKTLFPPIYPHENYTLWVKILISFPFQLFMVIFIIFIFSVSCLEQKPGLRVARPGWYFASFSYNIEESNYKLSKNKTRRLSLAERNLWQAMDFPKQSHVFHTACSYSMRKQNRNRNPL